MPNPKILVTRKLPTDVENRLMDTFETILNPTDEAYDSEKLIQQAENVDAILCTPCDQIGADLIAKLPDRIRIISTFSVGYEHIDIAAAMKRGITVTNTPGVLTDATADIALLLLLGASRRAHEGERLIREDSWTGWNPTQLMGIGLQGKRLGILGMGRIGQAVADRAKAFGMEIHYHNRRTLDYDAIYHDSPESLLGVSDFLSLHFPLTDQTKKFLNEERINLLPDNAVVINTARGGVVDDEALINALKSGRVAAAGLDVFDGEPKLHEGYRGLSNCFLLPHLGSATIETRNAMGFCAIDNLEAFFKGEDVPNPVTA
ncbi:D-glycerate dehydrogenase [Terasakiella sp. A23]|uniref:2-hydroxyacid dehydrogenase n=1 Tax=Terasakiella sp. FCG-A23 TaxID=3080561 RepID=UPI002953181C|nr:D-glycerate dehydrogenase [Terasakiella sp. A23]MDV7340873.1 D-glycerate dehydrogenase [Terasakiella sp. A23]